MKTCAVEGCPGKPVGRGLCMMHYKRWQRGSQETRIADPLCNQFLKLRL